MINPLLQAGFILDQILEPLPIEEFYEKDPEEYEELMPQPGFYVCEGNQSIAGCYTPRHLT